MTATTSHPYRTYGRSLRTPKPSTEPPASESWWTRPEMADRAVFSDTWRARERAQAAVTARLAKVTR